MDKADAAIIGGGAAGYFAAISCAENAPGSRVLILEKSPNLLTKVRISGGGRCNVCPACFDPQSLVTHYPRGAKALLGVFYKFQPKDTIEWFESRDVPLKTEPDGRVFPASNHSSSIVTALEDAARAAGVEVRTCLGEVSATKVEQGYQITSKNGASITARAVLIATGGCRAGDTPHPATQLGHTVSYPVPSLFSIALADEWPKRLSGVSVPCVTLSLPAHGISQSGPLLLTHTGISGPATLRLSAWAARVFSEMHYRCEIRADFIPHTGEHLLLEWIENNRQKQGGREVFNSPYPGIPSRLWKALAELAHIPPATRWCEISTSAVRALMSLAKSAPLQMVGKNANKDEFVTCGGVNLKEVDFRTMESKLAPGLYFAGEVLDLDGITGGYNFQAAWSTGWLAGKGMAQHIS